MSGRARYHLHSMSKIKMVQRRAAHIVTYNYDWSLSITNMLQNLQWEQLEHRQDNFHAIMYN